MDKDKKPTKHASGGIPFGLEILLFILLIFVIWVLTGGAKKDEDKPFITPLTDPVNPGMKYGPEDVRKTYNPNYQQISNTQYEPTDVVN